MFANIVDELEIEEILFSFNALYNVWEFCNVVASSWILQFTISF